MENAAHSGTNTQQFNNADELCCIRSAWRPPPRAAPPHRPTTYCYDILRNRTSPVPNRGERHLHTYDQANRLTSDSDRHRFHVHHPDHGRNLRL